VRRAALAWLVLVLIGVPSLALADEARVHRERLPSGFTVLVRENPLAPVVAASLLVPMGTRWERPENAGISNFLHAVMVKGTERTSGAELAEKIALLGGKLSASGDIDYSEIRGSALARFWRELLALTAELALEPKLAADDVDAERRFLLSRVQRRHDNATSRAFDALYAAVYDGHPYALPTIGTPESLARIDRAALVEWYRMFYRPERMVLAVSGQVSAPEVIAEVRRLFARLATSSGAPSPPPTSSAIPAPAPSSQRLVIEQPAQQVQVLLGGLAPPLDHPDHAAVKVLATVLGGGMAGRLFAELRDKRALAYTASAYYDPVREPGVLALYLGTAPENADRAEQALREEVARIKADPVGTDELRRAKGYLLGRYAMDRRTNERQAWYLAFYEIEHVGEGFPERYRQAVEAVTPADVQRVAQRYLGSVTTVVLRPAGTR
jgi:zinc protease